MCGKLEILHVINSHKGSMPKLIIIYGTGSHNTEFIAKAIEEGVKREGVTTVLKNVNDANKHDLSDVDAVAIGSPNYKYAMMPTIRNFLNELNDVDLRGKIGLAFGSYGWGLEAIEAIHNKLSLYGLELVEDFGVKRRPNEEQLEECRRVGSLLADKIKNKALMYSDIHNNLKKR